MKIWENTCTEKCTGKSHSATCRSRKRRMKDPCKYYHSNLKSRAKQRPKEFSITLEYFRQWCAEVDFVIGVDSVDRKDNELGYIEGNLNKIPLIDNIRKYWDWDRKRKGLDPLTDEEVNVKVETLTEQGWKPINEDITF
jgi:hypothetical protein